MFSSRSPPYSEHTDVFSADSTAVVLAKRTGINNYSTDLVDNRPPLDNLSSHPPALRYHSSVGKMVAFNGVLIIKVLTT